MCSNWISVTTRERAIYVRRINSRKHDYFQLVRSYRNEEGKPTQEVLVHFGEHETPEAALAVWPGEIAEHRRAGRDEQAEKLQNKLERLQELAWPQPDPHRDPL